MGRKLNTGLIFSYLAGECNSAEKRKVEKWIKSNPKNVKIVDEYRKIWELTGEANDNSSELFNPEEDWKGLMLSRLHF